MYRQIIIRTVKLPTQANPNKDIEWLCESFGLISGRDTEKMCQQILLTILRNVAKHGEVSAEDIAKELRIAPQRVNYHIRGLMQTGLIYREHKQIYLRDGSVKAAIEEMRSDANRLFDKMSTLAEEIDKSMGFKNR